MTNIEYPTFTSKIGIDPLLCRVDNDADNIFSSTKNINGNLCDKQKGQTDSCQSDNDVFIKKSMKERIRDKYGNTKFIDENTNSIIAMMKHPNYSKSLCHNTLNKDKLNDITKYSQAVLPYNYDYCDKNDETDKCNNYRNTIYEQTNTIPHDMINYKSKDEKNTSLSSEIFGNKTNTDIVDNNNDLCNNFYKVYCEKLNSMLKDKFGDKFNTSMLGEYENMCLCYQDMYKDYLPQRIYKGFRAPSGNNATNKITDQNLDQLLNNGGLMIDDSCYSQHTQANDKAIYAPDTNWEPINSANIVICNNMLNMNDTNIEANEQSNISFNQEAVCSTSNPTPKTDDKTTDKSAITDKDNQTDIKDNTETKDNELPNDTNKDTNKDSNVNDPNKSNDSNVNDSNNLESTKDKIINKIKENKTYAGIGGGVSLCCCCICCICIIMALSR